MKKFPLPTAASAAFLALYAIAPGLSSARPESTQIDIYIEDALRAKGAKSNPPSTDEEFLRRIYLDTIGRIPTYEEAKKFLDHKASNKRSKLINELLDSDGYVSHSTNWWADLLRMKTRGRGSSEGTGVAYRSFIKNSVKENLPYDAFVREMLNPSSTDPRTGKNVTGTAVFPRDNGAVGYYVRDQGMPFDNMSNTLQVFLGTRLVCAQCHDHPFDKWSQMDYHQLVAYTYNSIDTRIRPIQFLKLDRKLEREMKKNNDRYFLGALNELFQPIDNGIMPTERKLKLPHDYRSIKDRADPYEIVKPSTKGFGGTPAGRGRGKRLLDNYAAWLTSRENPRFTKVIVNRLWSRVMGRGLVEPLDDWKDSTEPSNRYVMDYLERTMASNNYDVKAMLKILYNTRTYQRQAFGDDIHSDVTYLFPGPILRRMTAEQIWDSFMTLAVPEIDQRKIKDTDNYGNYAAALLSMKPAEIASLASRQAAVERSYRPKIRSIRQKMGKADRSKAGEIQKEITKLTKELEEKIDSLRDDAFAATGAADKMGKESMMGGSMKMMGDEKMMAGDGGRWKGFNKAFLRASELPSPTPGGHFLRQFGQSDRETINNGSTEPSVDQALTLLNSPIFDKMFHGKSLLAKNLEKASSIEEKEDTLFISLLSRYPRDNDRALIKKQVASSDEETAFRNIAWALINTQEFVFLQ